MWNNYVMKINIIYLRLINNLIIQVTKAYFINDYLMY